MENTWPVGRCTVKKALLLCMLALLSAPVSNSQELATEKTTAQFLKMCEFVIDDNKQPQKFETAYLNTGLCLGYISGFLDSIPFLQHRLGKTFLCLPTSGVRADDVLQAIAVQVRKDPSLLKESARAAMFIALRGEYPCQ
jgi:hypothetical protein